MSTSAAGADPFAENEDQQSLRKLARDVAERELAPNARHWDETEEFPDASWDALRKADLFGITVGEQYGGMGMGDIEAAIALEELARADVSSAILAQLIYNGPPRAIEHLGTDALKERWLPLAASGSQRSFSESEPRCSIARGGPLKVSWARIADDTSTRASSSRTIAASMSPMPMPP